MLKSPPFALAIALSAWVSGAARAQLPQPRLTSLSRLGTAAGGTIDLTVRGTDLDGSEALWFDHPGLRAFHLRDLTFRVVCATGTPLGQHDVRAVGRYGVSNPRTFVVGDRPERAEEEPNDAPGRANPIALNSVVNAEIGATDVDCFAFEGVRGRRVLLDLAAERLESRLDATLRLIGPGGREIAESRDVFGADPFLDVTLPADGRYVVKVHDVVYAGSLDHPYRLTVTDGPHLDAVVPAVAASGVPTTFTLIGRNLGGVAAPDLRIDGRPLERKTVTLTPPPSRDLDPLSPSSGLLPSPAAPRRGFEFVLGHPSGSSNPIFIAEAADPVVLEREPNDPDGRAQEVTPPCDISGTFGAPGDTDVYRFAARKGAVWWIEASAERLGSPADPAFVVQKVVGDGPPRDLADGDDLPDQGGAARFHMGTVDAATRWEVPEDGVYQVAINDLYTAERGDPRLFYRLNIRPERPDFRLFVVPENPLQTDAVEVGAGGRTGAVVLAWRTDGFDGPIRVEARELPPGVRAEPVVIAAGKVMAPIVFEADEAARPVVGVATLVGRARTATRKEGVPDVAHEALAGTMSWPPPNPESPSMASARVTRGFVLAVREPSPFTLTVKPSTRTVLAGRPLPLEIALTRRGGFTDAVAATGSDLPPQIVNAVATIAPGASSCVLRLSVAADAAPGSYTLLVRGTGAFPFSKDVHAPSKPSISLDAPSNPITVVVRAAPVRLGLEGRGGVVTRGGTLEVAVTLARQAGFADGLVLTLAAPVSSKLSAPPVAVAPGQAVATLVVHASPDSPEGAAPEVAVRAVAAVGGVPVEVDEPLAVTVRP